MAVPEEIRKVPRPPNTVIVEGRSNSPYRWAVHERAFVRYVKGMKNPQPHNGKTIGYIIDGKFVPRVTYKNHEKARGQMLFQTNSLQYGVAAAIRPLVKDIQEDLVSVWPAEDASQILAIATIRVMNPLVPDRRLQYYYEKSFVSLHYPGIQLTEETVHRLFEKVGGSLKNRFQFSTLRLSHIAKDHSLTIDRILKQDNEPLSELAAYTGKKSAENEHMKLSVFYAYDVESGEPVCSEVFPEDTADLPAYESFIGHNQITKGILVNDKSLSPGILTEMLSAHPDLHFLIQINQDTMPEEEILNSSNTTAPCKKQALPNGHFLYCYRNTKSSESDDERFSMNAVHGGQPDNGKHDPKKTYDVNVYESDLNLPPETVCLCFENRWQMEMIIRSYKTPGQLDHATIGSEFVNFISSLITSRLIREIRDTGMFQRLPYADIIEDLKNISRKVNAPEPVTGDKYWLNTNEEDFYVLEKLGLSIPNPAHPVELRDKWLPPIPEEKDGPKGNQETQPEEQNKRRGPGRPRIHPPKDPDEPQKTRGRPRKNPPKDPNEPKKSRGRPRKKPPKDPDEPKRPRGRPRKNSVQSADLREEIPSA